VSDDLMFEQTSFLDIDNKLDCMAAQKYFAANVSTYRMELQNAGYDYDQIEAMIDGLWKNLIESAKATKAPLSKAAQLQKHKLGL
jgi:hypothetical protein